MATGTYTPDPFEQYCDNQGDPLVAGFLYTYIAGTSTPVATYSDVNLTTQNANPIVLDGAGRPSSGAIFLTPGASYKFVLKDSGGNSIATRDNILAVPSSSASVDVIGTAGEALTAGAAVYLSDGSGGKSAGQWYLGSSTNTYSSTLNDVGMAPSAIAAGASGTIRQMGQVTGLTSLTVGALYYLSTAGAITISAPSNRRLLGQADSTSSLILFGNPPPIPVSAGLGIAVSAAGVISQSTPFVTLTDGATVALNAALGMSFSLVAAGNRTLLAPTNPTDGQKIIIFHLASGGARTLTLTGGAGGFAFCTDIPAITVTGSGLTDAIGAIYNGNAWLVVAYVKGF